MANKNDIKYKAIANTIWKFVEQVGSQVVNFVVQIVLARILLPEEFGTIALVTIFIAIFDVFLLNGLGTALIQKKEIDDIDCSSVLYSNMLLSIVLYVILFFLAPLLSQFYDNDSLVPIIRILGITLFFSSIRSVQQAIVSKQLRFKLFFYSTLSGTIISAIIGIFLALNGAGVWSLVAQYVIKSFVDMCVLFFTMNWRPKFLFSISRLIPLISYGWKILAAALVDTVYNNIRDMIIGKKYSPDDLAFFNRGKSFPNLVSADTMHAVGTVLFPIVSSVQDDKESVKRIIRRYVKDTSYILIPLLIGLAVVAKPLVVVLLTDKWLPCVPYLQIYCIALTVQPMHTANMQLIKALGRSDITLKMEIIKKIIGVILILMVMKYGVLWIALTTIVHSVIVLVINAYPSREIINYTYSEQIKDSMPAYLLSIAMAIAIYPISLLNISNILIICSQTIGGLFIIILLSTLFKVNSFYSIKSSIINYFNFRK